MTYKELLLQPEWRRKRTGIVERDALSCVNCKNKAPLEKVSGSFFMRTSVGKAEHECYSLIENRPKHFFISRNDTKWTNSIPSKYVVVYHEPIKTYSGLEILKMTEQEIRVMNLVVPIAIRELEFPEYCEDGNDIKLTREIQGINGTHQWIMNRTLHVHHKYYQIGKLPWEYPNDALITLCYIYHEKLHKTTQIPLIDSHDAQIRFLNPCKKCGGTGELPEYHYYMRGVCFSCDGSGFTDLENVASS